MNNLVVFLAPPYFRYFGSQNRRMMPGLHSLAMAAQAAGSQVMVYNADHDQAAGDSYADWYSIAHNWPVYRKSLQVGHPALDEMIGTLTSLCPQTVVLATGDTLVPTTEIGSLDAAEAAGRAIRRALPDVRLVVYGPHVAPNEFFVSGWAHNLILGEGEAVIGDVLKAGPSGPASVVGGNLTPEGMAALPYLDPSLLLHSVAPHDLDYILAGRGCPGRCTFCLVPTVSQSVRRLPVDRFLDEVEWRAENFGVRWFYIADPCFEPDKDRAIELCKAMCARRFSEKGIRWICDARVDTLPREKIEWMQLAGCVQVKIGVEFGDDVMLRRYDKGISTKQVSDCFRRLKKLRMRTTCYVMLGQPGATAALYEKSYDFLRGLEADHYVVNVTVPHLGTPLWEKIFGGVSGRTYGEPGFGHLSGDLFDMWGRWGLTPEIVERFLALSADSKGKEDALLRKFERRLLF